MTLPGIARHMLCLHLRGSHDLPKRDPAVARRNALLPVWRKTFLGQAPNRAFEQTPIEKTAACQDNAPFIDAPTNRDDGLDQALMKTRGHDAPVTFGTQIGEQRFNERPP